MSSLIKSADENDLFATDLSNFSFKYIFDNLREDTRNVLGQGHFNPKQVERILITLRLLIALCDRWIKSKKVDKEVRDDIKEKRRELQSDFNDIVRRSDVEPKGAWTHAPIYKTTNRQLAEQWLRAGLISRLDEIYLELSPQQTESLVAAHDRWVHERENATPENAWVDSPLLGRAS